jgi:hypothetical protein
MTKVLKTGSATVFVALTTMENNSASNSRKKRRWRITYLMEDEQNEMENDDAEGERRVCDADGERRC